MILILTKNNVRNNENQVTPKNMQNQGGARFFIFSILSVRLYSASVVVRLVCRILIQQSSTRHSQPIFDEWIFPSLSLGSTFKE